MNTPRRIWDANVTTTSHKPAEERHIPSPLDAYPPTFGTENLRTRWFSACRRQSSESRHRFSVSPSCSLYTVDGRHLHEGERVTPQDVGGWGVLTQLRQRMVVIENTANTDSPELPPAA